MKLIAVLELFWRVIKSGTDPIIFMYQFHFAWFVSFEPFFLGTGKIIK